MVNFKTDLQRGELGLQQLLRRFPALQATDGRRGDILAPDGSKIELKSDSYAHDRTANYFMERYSSVEVLSPGGPWQAATHECEWFVYYYLTSQIGYVFSTKQLVEQLDAIVGQLKPVEVRNVRWTTVGFKVPRSMLVPACMFTPNEIVGEASQFVATWVGPVDIATQVK